MTLGSAGINPRGGIHAPNPVAAARTMTKNRYQALRGRWGWTGRGTGHRHHLHVTGIPMVSVKPTSGFSVVCSPRKKSDSRPFWRVGCSEGLPAGAVHGGARKRKIHMLPRTIVVKIEWSFHTDKVLAYVFGCRKSVYLRHWCMNRGNANEINALRFLRKIDKRNKFNTLCIFMHQSLTPSKRVPRSTAGAKGACRPTF
jgi:hypothetical protein